MVSASLSRRALLAGTTSVALASQAFGREVSGALPWAPNAADPPQAAQPGPWTFFAPEEGVLMEAIADRLIPPDPPGTPDAIPGGKDAGCAVFIDRQLSGPYGRSAGLYMKPPFLQGTAEQGMQNPKTPAQQYRDGLAAIDRYIRAATAGKAFHELAPGAQDGFLQQMEAGHVQLDGTVAAKFFDTLVTDIKQGFLTDPLYGGNKDMVGWKMIGFPGARYDYSDWIKRHNERYPLPPVAIGGGRPAWQAAKKA
jgi:gluconate 2-dehydrogenase gamma chain